MDSNKSKTNTGEKTEKNKNEGHTTSEQSYETFQEIGQRTGTGNFTPEELEGVIDQDAYRKWRRLMKLPILNDQRRVMASDNVEVDLGWLTHYFEARIDHLPPLEKNELLQKKSIYLGIHLTANKWKVKAYGMQPKSKSNKKGKFPGFLKSKQGTLIELFGKMFTVEEVHKIIVEEWNFPVAINDVIEFKKTFIGVISEKVELHKKEYSDLRLVQKRSRLEELTDLYNRLKDKLKIAPHREDIKVLVQIVDSIRKEVEGEKLHISGGLDLKIESDIAAHLQKEVFKEFSLSQIIIGRVASRMGIDSSRIVQGLNNSYYSRYNRFLGNEPEDVEFEDVTYPSNMGYDFEAIKANYKESEATAKREKDALNISEAQSSIKVAKEGFKESLLRKLSEKAGEVKASRFKVQQTELTKSKKKP